MENRGAFPRKVEPVLPRGARPSLYLHVPFCAAKCGYCSFYSRRADDGEVAAWLDALEAEARTWRERLGGRIPLRTLYVGGGTPSLLTPGDWRRVLRTLEAMADLSSLEEASVEANPSSLTKEHLTVWKDGGFTRVSLGVQSLDDGELRRIGRLHDAAGALRAMEVVLDAGLRLSVDLIFGLPDQTLRSWSASLRGVLAAGAGHLSTYQLTLEPDAPMSRQGFPLPDGYPLYRYAQWFLAKKKFLQYEISSFAPAGAECRHNLAYWRQEPVLPLGPAAWGYLDGWRWSNPPTLEAYLEAARHGFPNPFAGAERLSPRARVLEAAILALRTRWGIDRLEFSRRWGAGMLREVEGVLLGLPPHLLRVDERSLALTPAGMRVGNAVWAELMALEDPNTPSLE